MCCEEMMCERNTIYSGGRLSWLAHGAALDVPLTAQHSVHTKILGSAVSQFHSERLDYASVTVVFFLVLNVLVSMLILPPSGGLLLMYKIFRSSVLKPG
jgi:hypothetical protein